MSSPALADRIVDLSADFRLRDAGDYVRVVRQAAREPGVAAKLVYGLPELHRAELRARARQRRRLQCHGDDARRLAAGRGRTGRYGARHHLRSQGREQRRRRRVERLDASSRARRRHAQLRAHGPSPHRRSAAGAQAAGVAPDVHLSATAVDNVRGVLATAHVFVKPGTRGERSVEGLSRGLRRRAVRAHREGARRACIAIRSRRSCPAATTPTSDSSSTRNRPRGRACAIDNLMKGAAGTARAMREHDDGMGRDAGPRFTGLHPI